MPQAGYSTYSALNISVVPTTIPGNLQIYPIGLGLGGIYFDPGHVFIRYYLGGKPVGQQKLELNQIQPFVQALDPYVQSIVGSYKYGSFANPEEIFTWP